jgi:NAD+ kinase
VQVGGGDATDAAVVDSFEQSRYEILLGAELAGVLHYRRRTGYVELSHTEIDQAFQGRGLAGRLAAAAFADARSRHGKVQVTCPFVSSYLQRHPEFSDLVVSAATAAAPAGERIDS